MANLFQSLVGKLGLSKSTVVDQAESVLDQNRDKIPDQFEGAIESALHGDMVGGLLDKIGLGGEEEAAPAEAEATEEVPAEEEATETEATAEEEATTEEEAPAEEEATAEEETTEEGAPAEEEASEEETTKETEDEPAK